MADLGCLSSAHSLPVPMTTAVEVSQGMTFNSAPRKFRGELRGAVRPVSLPCADLVQRWGGRALPRTLVLVEQGCGSSPGSPGRCRWVLGQLRLLESKKEQPNTGTCNRDLFPKEKFLLFASVFSSEV